MAAAVKAWENIIREDTEKERDGCRLQALIDFVWPCASVQLLVNLSALDAAW